VSSARALYASSQVRDTGARQVTLVDLLDRLLAGGVVVHGHITLAAADIDLVDLDLAILLAATDKAAGR
jgi:Gas vesicle protein